MFFKVRTDLSILTRTNVCTFYIKFHTFNITIISKVFYLTRLFIHIRAFVRANRLGKNIQVSIRTFTLQHFLFSRILIKSLLF